MQQHELIDTLRRRGVTDERVLKAMATVPRHLFVSRALQRRAYEDTALPIEHAQTISQPYTVATMTEAAHVKRGSKVLEIGTGSGFQAAILAELGAKVYTIERHHNLSVAAQQVLRQLGYHMLFRVGDGTIGWNEHAPYDAILVTAGAPDVPETLARQLAIGGRLVVPVGDMGEQQLYVVTRTSENDWSADNLGPCKFVPLIGRQGWDEA